MEGLGEGWESWVADLTNSLLHHCAGGLEEKGAGLALMQRCRARAVHSCAPRAEAKNDDPRR